MVVDREGHGVEHVLPVALLPASILGEVDPKRWVAPGERDRDLAFRRPAVSDERLAHGLRGVSNEWNGAGLRDPRDALPKSVQPVQGRCRMPMHAFDDERSRFKALDELLDDTTGFAESAMTRDEAQRRDAGGDDSAAGEDGIAEIAEPGVKGENRIGVVHIV